MWQRSWEQDVFPTVSDHSLVLSLVGGAHLKGERTKPSLTITEGESLCNSCSQFNSYSKRPPCRMENTLEISEVVESRGVYKRPRLIS